MQNKFIVQISVAAIVFLVFTFSASAQDKPMTFKLVSNGGNCDGCEWIAAQGEIDSGTPDRLRRFIRENGKIGAVVLNSPGGDLIAGLELGRIFREQGVYISVGNTVEDRGNPPWKVQEPGYCFSACAYAFLGGKFRTVGENELGFHQFYDEKALENPDLAQFSGADRYRDQLVTGVIVRYLIEMNIDLGVYQRAVLASPEEIYMLGAAEARELGVDNSGGTLPGEWQLLPFERGLVAETKIGPFLGNPKKSRLRFYCSKRVPYIALFVDADPFDSGEDFAGFLRETYKESGPVLSAGEQNLSVKLLGVFSSKNRRIATIVLRLGSKSARKFASSSSLTSNLLVLSRSQESAFEIWNLGDIPGDRRMLGLALANCIN